MRQKGLPEKRVSNQGLALIASLVLHGVLVTTLFITWQSWHKTEVPPVVSVRLVSIPAVKTREETPVIPVSKPVEQKPVAQKKKIPEPSTRALAIERQKKAKAEAHEKALEKKKREDWLKKQEVLKEKARIRALENKKAREAAERKKQEEAQKALQQQLKKQAQEKLKQIAVQNARKQAEITRTQKLVAQYSALIRQRVTWNWSYPLDSSRQMSATVKLMLTPTGELMNLSLVKSSGNNTFDQSVLQAVRASSPFDFLNQVNIRVFESSFRTLTLKFTPQDLLE